MYQVDGLIRLMEGENTGPINIGNPGIYVLAQKSLESSLNPNMFLVIYLGVLSVHFQGNLP